MKILISGASKGIGLYLAKKMSEDGYAVHGTFHRTSPPKGIEASWEKVDVADPGEASEWVASIASAIDDIVLINCAGVNYNSYAHKASVEDWRRVIDVNLVGTFHLICAVLPFMRERGFGRIINFSSVLAQKGIPGTSAYAASKAALWGMTKSIAVENASKGITINNINLGYFDIGMIKDVPAQMIDEIMKTIPMGRLGDPKNIYNAVKFLIESDYITGTSIDINGGLY